jgi:hypothetical protein
MRFAHDPDERSRKITRCADRRGGGGDGHGMCPSASAKYQAAISSRRGHHTPGSDFA